jgi:hypothetical protein
MLALTVSLQANAAREYQASVTEAKGTLVLRNKDGVSVTLNSDALKVEIKRPSVGSPLRMTRGERVLKISDSTNAVEFRIPSKNMNSSEDFQVSADDSEQNANVRSVIFKEFQSSRQLEKSVDCSYLEPRLVSALDDKGNPTINTVYDTISGTQNIVVQEVKWLETVKIQISNESGSIKLKTSPELLTSETKIKDLNSCH